MLENSGARIPPPPSENKTLKAARHAAIPIWERVNHHEIQMRHCCANHDRMAGGAIQFCYELVHQSGHKLNAWSFVDPLTSCFVSDKDRPSGADTVTIASPITLAPYPQVTAQHGQAIRPQ